MIIRKTAGNLFALCVLWSCAYLSASVSLRIVDERGRPLQAVQVGRPFVIEVAVTGNNNTRQTPDIEGLELLTVQEKGWGYQSINGNTTITHNYTARATEPGTITIGPATLGSESSNVITVSVGEHENAQLNEGEQDDAYMLSLRVDKSRVVKGERVVARLRFYYLDSAHMLRNLIEQESPSFNRKKARGPLQGNEKVDGTMYRYLEWNWDMYPQKTGTLMVPAFGAEYEQERQRDHLWGGLGRLFGAHRELKRVYSNAVPIEVAELPESDRPVNGIGTVDSFTLSAHPAAARQGEGMVVALELSGSIDPDAIKLEGLQGIPDELRSYESQQTIHEPTAPEDTVRIRYEYILQGLKTGSYQLPAQQFHFYDTHDRSFKTIKTAPLAVTIMPGTTKQTNSLKQPPHDQEQPLNHLPITDEYWQPAYQYGIIPWWLFLLLGAIPFLVGMFKKGHASMDDHRKKNFRARRAHSAFTTAITHLEKIHKKGKPELLYTVFIELFADRWQMPVSMITQERIDQRLHDVGMSENNRAQWNQFFNAVAAHAFGGMGSKKQIENLFTEARSWLEELQQLL